MREVTTLNNNQFWELVLKQAPQNKSHLQSPSPATNAIVLLCVAEAGRLPPFMLYYDTQNSYNFNLYYYILKLN